MNTTISPLGSTTFIVYLFDAIGDLQTHSTDVVTVKLVGSPNGNLTEISFVVSPTSQYNVSHYAVTYGPTIPGQYAIEVLVNSQPIGGNPYYVNVTSMKRERKEVGYLCYFCKI
jgi:Filamin/ABP280 repeat